ncbi:MAG TPA: peptidase T [Chitinophagales bacterium]|nr:peptidase T [Chitinophagales bacterium]HRK28557.1 peptidase T [Chitinophagales bacterium]
MLLPNIQHTVTERFLRYVQIDTQSDPTATRYPSTEKQKDLARLLVAELHAMGITDAEMDEWGVVYATLEATSNKPDVPVICLCSHIDTAPDSSGTGVKPLIHPNYQGQDIVLPDDTTQVIRLQDHPHLNMHLGHDIITASGTTLLGADNKAGVAAIMDAAHFLVNNPQIPHGKIRILFTPDEEIGRGADKVAMQKLGAAFGYTVDGQTPGSIEYENFNADAVDIFIQGISAHTGTAKGKMENAIKIAAAFIDRLPKNHLTPESTEMYGGFIHPKRVDAYLEHASVGFLLRDFTLDGLHRQANLLKTTLEQVLLDYPNATYTFTQSEQYRNMQSVVDQFPQVVAYAEEAIKRTGLAPVRNPIRGGTDGARLSFMGMPCPNLYVGEYASHSKQEWISRQVMEQAVQTLIHLCMVWEENS